MDIDFDSIEQLAKIARECGISRLRVGDIEIEMPSSNFVVSASTPSPAQVIEDRPVFSRPKFISGKRLG